MLYLDKRHDPRRNKKLIAEISGIEHGIEQAVQETDALFDELDSYGVPAPILNTHIPLKGIKKLLTRFFLKPARILPAKSGETCVDEDELVFPEWKKQMDHEYELLMNKIKTEVSVTDFGAVGDGVTDCTEAFKKAVGKGNVKVYIPAGVFITRGIKLPSWTCLIGEGKGITTIKLHDKANRGAWIITNSRHLTGNRNILIEGMSLDWNVQRLEKTVRTSSGNNRSSCLTFANVKYGWVKNIEGIDAGLHCFDVSSTIYTYMGDGTRARGGSEYIWLDHLNGHGFGDDGITTHHSDHIIISNSHMSDPSGRAHKKGFSNSNGIEVDDGSRNVWLINNSTARCFGGIEVKAHHNVSAASNVHIIGHLSLNDNRSFNFRHIGHHKLEDPESLTAYNIKATNIVSIAPIHSELYLNSKPRGMVVSAYKNVAVNHFTLIGDPEYDYEGEPIIAIQYRARNIAMNNIRMKGFKKAGKYIKVFGGRQHADFVSIENVHVDNFLKEPIFAGKEIKNINIRHIYALKEEMTTPL